jgi:hypothetical protein
MVERCRLLGEDHRMAVVVVEHEGADAQSAGRCRDGRQGRERCQLRPEGVGHEVVAEQEGGIPEVFRAAGLFEQLLPRRRALAEHPEPEAPVVDVHLLRSPLLIRSPAHQIALTPTVGGSRRHPSEHRRGRSGCTLARQLGSG